VDEIVKEIKELRAESMAYNARNREEAEDDIAFELGGESAWNPQIWEDRGNRPKVTIDSLKGICFNDDKQVRKITAEMFDDKDNPRCEVLVQEYVSKWQKVKRLMLKRESNEIM
jgi:Holliday junction resolvase RusA-like endonuclease